MLVLDTLSAVLAQRPHATDLHFAESGRLYARTPLGDMEQVANVRVDSHCFEELTGIIGVEAVRTELGRAGGARDDAIDTGGHRYRWHVCLTAGTARLQAVVRRMQQKAPTFSELLLPTATQNWLAAHHGLILVCGATNSGKSTSLAAMVHHYNQTRAGHIVTVEDPIEHFHDHARCLVTHRQVGRDCESFARGLHDALREDPDLLVVGEIRDRATMATALAAAETGLLVLGTMHAASAGRAVERVIDFAIDDDKSLWRAQLGHSLIGVLVQVLLPRSDGSGRVLATEAMARTPLHTALISSGQTHKIEESLRQHTDEAAGVWPLNFALQSLTTAGLIDAPAALRASYSRPDLARLLRVEASWLEGSSR
jgi:pilus retraction protein PilT